MPAVGRSARVRKRRLGPPERQLEDRERPRRARRHVHQTTRRRLLERRGGPGAAAFLVAL
jgi:hypothetical protein